MVTFVAIVLWMLVEPLTILAGVAVGALVKKRALVEPLALGAAIVMEIALILVLAGRGVDPMILAARGMVMLLWAHLGHLFVHGFTPIEDDDRAAVDVHAAALQDRVLLKVMDVVDGFLRPGRGTPVAVRSEDAPATAPLRTMAVPVVELSRDTVLIAEEGSDEGR